MLNFKIKPTATIQTENQVFHTCKKKSIEMTTDRKIGTLQKETLNIKIQLFSTYGKIYGQKES